MRRNVSARWKSTTASSKKRSWESKWKHSNSSRRWTFDRKSLRLRGIKSRKSKVLKSKTWQKKICDRFKLRHLLNSERTSKISSRRIKRTNTRRHSRKWIILNEKPARLNKRKSLHSLPRNPRISLLFLLIMLRHSSNKNSPSSALSQPLRLSR